MSDDLSMIPSHYGQLIRRSSTTPVALAITSTCVYVYSARRCGRLSPDDYARMSARSAPPMVLGSGHLLIQTGMSTEADTAHLVFALLPPCWRSASWVIRRIAQRAIRQAIGTKSEFRHEIEISRVPFIKLPYDEVTSESGMPASTAVVAAGCSSSINPYRPFVGCPVNAMASISLAEAGGRLSTMKI